IDWSEVQQSAHGIRGAAANLGLIAVTSAALAVEQAVRVRNLEEARRQLGALSAALLRANRALFADATETQSVNDTLDGTLPVHITSDLTQLRATLAHNELDDVLAERVAAGLETHGAASEAAALRSALDLFDFETARTVVEQLLEAAEAATEPVDAVTA
ncbi:MAG TPA: Hpt domain-containing protein, partial [Gemmatimonas sp.]|uniref:Hpt domain-containing protein n=1 Tax=Gemmatimonas sp. TaxID=1962908 RepID=UPI002ED8CEBD